MNLLLLIIKQSTPISTSFSTLMSQTQDAFPLASEVYNDAPSADSGTEAGAAGDSSSNSVSISQGGMIAIIVVVVVVSLIGSTCCQNVVSLHILISTQFPPLLFSSSQRGVSGRCERPLESLRARLSLPSHLAEQSSPLQSKMALFQHIATVHGLMMMSRQHQEFDLKI